MEYEVGRYRVVVGELYNKSIAGKLKVLMEILMDMGIGWMNGNAKMKPVNSEYFMHRYLDKNPDSQFAKLYAKDKDMAIARFEEMRLSQLKAIIVELRFAALLFGAMLAMGMDMDDDDTPDYKEYFVGRQVHSMMERLVNELTFFMLPSSFNEILKSPISIKGIMIPQML